MSYCRWLGGDLYAYPAANDYVIRIAVRCVNDEVKAQYNEPTRHALLARVFWLDSKGCDYPWDELRYMKEDIIAEVKENEKAAA